VELWVSGSDILLGLIRWCVSKLKIRYRLICVRFFFLQCTVDKKHSFATVSRYFFRMGIKEINFDSFTFWHCPKK
jgi:hypothetical protein